MWTILKYFNGMWTVNTSDKRQHNLTGHDYPSKALTLTWRLAQWILTLDMDSSNWLSMDDRPPFILVTAHASIHVHICCSRYHPNYISWKDSKTFLSSLYRDTWFPEPWLFNSKTRYMHTRRLYVSESTFTIGHFWSDNFCSKKITLMHINLNEEFEDEFLLDGRK